MGGMVNIPVFYWVQDVLDDVFWTDKKYEINHLRVPKIDIDFFR